MGQLMSILGRQGALGSRTRRGYDLAHVSSGGHCLRGSALCRQPASSNKLYWQSGQGGSTIKPITCMLQYTSLSSPLDTPPVTTLRVFCLRRCHVGQCKCQLSMVRIFPVASILIAHSLLLILPIAIVLKNWGMEAEIKWMRIYIVVAWYICNYYLVVDSGWYICKGISAASNLWERMVRCKPWHLEQALTIFRINWEMNSGLLEFVNFHSLLHMILCNPTFENYYRYVFS